MQAGSWATIVVGISLALGCSGPSLDLPHSTTDRVAIELEPASADGAVPALFRARLRAAAGDGAPWLFRDEVSDYYRRALARGEVPAVLQSRAVPLRFWREGPDVWLQPSVWLEPGAAYTLGFTNVGVLEVLRVAQANEARTQRLFPPEGRPKHRISVVCGASVDALPSSLMLEPGGVSLSVVSDLPGLDEGCVTLSVDAELSESVVAPPTLADVLLEPSLWLPSSASAAAPSPACLNGELFHAACLELLDDRVRITAQGDDALWLLDSPRRLAVSAPAGARTLLLGELSPSSQLTLRGTVLTSAGQRENFDSTFTTAAARRHVVLNEVLANPAGPEPSSEWIELVNDSAQPVSLSGLWLEDSGASAALPAAELAPGELALLVGHGFRASNTDVPIPEGVRRFELASLGARGLSNSGEALLLVGPEGVISRFPLLAAPHAGHSVARRALDGADDDPTNFAEHAAPGASPGAPNSFDATGP